MKNFLRLTPSLDGNGHLVKVDGLIQFRLGMWVGGKEVAKLTVNSGSPGRQDDGNLRLYSSPNALPGSLEPIPEGEYHVGKYEVSPNGDWGPGLGPVWFQLTPKGSGRRSDFGIHLDANRGYAAGSAGCVVAVNMTDLNIIKGWQDKYGFDLLVVDHGLGTVTKPSPPVQPAPTPEPKKYPAFKIVTNDNGSTLFVYENLAPGEYQMYSDAPGWTGKLKSK